MAFTRVAGREDILILRPFEAAPFQKGIGLGRELLLRHLRGEQINWKALLAKYCEERPCATCGERRQCYAFTAGQWKRADSDRVCRECSKHYADAGTPWQCNVCKQWHMEDNFPMKQRQRQCSFYRVCLTCEVKKPCYACQKPKPESEFGAAAWRARNADRRICQACAVRVRGYWLCAQCHERLPQEKFTAWKEKKHYMQNGTQNCNACISANFLRRIARVAAKRMQPLRRRMQRLRQEGVLKEIRAAIRVHVAGRHDVRPTESAATAETASQRQLYNYECLYCQQTVTSSVFCGQVEHRRKGNGCGKQFRVQDGVVSRPLYFHPCPKCGTVVSSKLPSVWPYPYKTHKPFGSDMRD